MQGEFSIIAEDRMPSVGPALETDHHIGPLRKHVRDLSFSLIAPVGAHDCFDHLDSSCAFEHSRTGVLYPIHQ